MADRKRSTTSDKTSRRSGHAIRVYVDQGQLAIIERKAKKVGLSASSYLLMAGLERPDRSET